MIVPLSKITYHVGRLLARSRRLKCKGFLGSRACLFKAHLGLHHKTTTTAQQVHDQEPSVRCASAGRCVGWTYGFFKRAIGFRVVRRGPAFHRARGHAPHATARLSPMLVGKEGAWGDVLTCLVKYDDLMEKRLPNGCLACDEGGSLRSRLELGRGGGREP